MLLQIDINVDKVSTFATTVRDSALAFAPKAISAILVLLIGLWLIKLVSKLIQKFMIVKKYDTSLMTFLLSFFKVIMNILLIITVASMLGINTTSFAALIAGAGIAIGAALNGSLGNFAGGVMLLVFKPFKIGDLVEAQGVTGTITEMGIFNTIILTPDNKTVIVPNGPLSTNVITNYTTAGHLRVDLAIAISLDQDVDKAREVALTAMKQFPGVLDSPSPEVAVLKVADFMTTLAIRPYCTQVEYWNVYFGVQEAVKKAFDANGIVGPTPTRIIINKTP